MCEVSAEIGAALHAIIPVILAAGASSRMGQRKECLEFGRLTCLDLALDACAQAGLFHPIVVTRAEREADLSAHLRARRTRAIFAINANPDLGQTSSLRAGLRVLPPEMRAFLIYPVDFPLVRGSDVERLCDVFVKATPPALVVAPSFARRRGHTVVVDASLAAPLLALPDGASAREVLGPVGDRTRYVEFGDDRLLTDMDTPQDYQRCLARWAFGG